MVVKVFVRDSARSNGIDGCLRLPSRSTVAGNKAEH